MSANLDALVEGIRAQRSEKLPQAKARLEKLKAAKEAVLTTRTRAAAVAANNPDLQTKLGSVSYETALQLLEVAIEAGDQAVKRLSRESINIGVAGKARQGKSQVLQMLTGLNDKQIPTGDGGYCTGSRSVIRNAGKNLAQVYFKESADLMQQIILPLCTSLGVSPRPGSVRSFVQTSLPAQPNDIDKVNEWNNLDELQRDLRDNPELMEKLDAQPIEVDFNDLRRYVTKDEGDKWFQVVDHVYVETCFDSGLPQGMKVFDLPGLEDPTQGVLETMLTSIKKDADIVFLMRKPDPMGDDWGQGDIKINNDLQKIYAKDGIEPKDWLLLVMNHVREHEKIDKDGKRKLIPDNEKNLDKMLGNVQYRFPGFCAVKCDCGSKDAVRAMVNENIEVLVQQTSRIDDMQIRQADVSFNTAIGEVRALYDALRNASGDILAQESGFDFERHLLSFMCGLRDPFKKDIAPVFRNSVREILARHFKEAEAKLGQIYDANESAEDFPPELPVFSRTRLKQEFGAGDGPAGVVEKTVRNQREAVLKLLRDHLAKCCDELVACYYDCVVKTGFASNPSLNRILSVGAGATSSYVRLEQFLSAVRASGSFPSIESALEGVLRLELTFDNSILPALYSISELDDFNPDLPPEAKRDGSHELDDIKAYLSNDIHDSEDRATAFCNWLRQKSESILSCVTSGSASSPLFQISEHIANTMRANYDAFVFRFIWGEMTTNEWRRLANRNKAIFWKEEFDRAAANSQIAKDWQSAIAGLASAL